VADVRHHANQITTHAGTTGNFLNGLVSATVNSGGYITLTWTGALPAVVCEEGGQSRL
jgi:hypothetical protein